VRKKSAKLTSVKAPVPFSVKATYITVATGRKRNRNRKAAISAAAATCPVEAFLTARA
jgi:hypothetical protein